MSQIIRSASVPFSAEKMFKLVNDVQSYPEFVPGCVGVKILRQQQGEMMVRVDVTKAGISKSFTTRNDWQNSQQINMTLVHGPFKHLSGKWNFVEIDSHACKIEMVLEFEFKNPLVKLAFGSIFKELTANMVTAFCQRAQHIYGAQAGELAAGNLYGQ